MIFRLSKKNETIDLSIIIMLVAQPSSYDGSVHAHSREVGSRNAVDDCRLGLRGDESFVEYLGGC